MIEAIAGVLILGLIAVASSKIMLELRKQEDTSQIFSLEYTKLFSTLLELGALLENSTNIFFENNRLHFTSKDFLSHTISLASTSLYLDLDPILLDVRDFSAYPAGKNWVLKICMKKCLTWGILMHGE